MLTQIVPDTLTKLQQLRDATLLEPAGDQPQSERRAHYQSRSLAECITNVAVDCDLSAEFATWVGLCVSKSCEFNMSPSPRQAL